MFDVLFTSLGVMLIFFLLLAPIAPRTVMFFTKDDDFRNRYTATFTYMALVGVWLVIGLSLPSTPHSVKQQQAAQEEVEAGEVKKASITEAAK